MILVSAVSNDAFGLSRDSVCVLKRGDSLLIVRPALAVDLAG
jgi:hypothetical protein